MGYSKSLADTYAKNRARYRSSDGALTRVVKKIGVTNKTVLDFGCGDGSESERLLDWGAQEVIGVDSSAQMIALARAKKFPRTIFRVTNGRSIPTKNKRFDLVFSRFVFHYIPDTKALFKELGRVTKQSGHLVALFQCLTNDQKKTNTTAPIDLGSGAHVTKIKTLAKSIDHLVEDLRAGGFNPIKVSKLKNNDSRISPSYPKRSHFKNETYLVVAKKI